MAAAEQLQAFSCSFRCEVHGQPLPRDAWYAGLRHVKNGGRSEDEALKRLARSPSWVWTAMDPESTLLWGMDVGTRTLAMAQRVGHQVVQG